MDTYVTARVVFISLIIFHCLLILIGGLSKIYIPPKLYKFLFFLEVSSITGGIIYTLMTAISHEGIALYCIFLAPLYFLMFLTYICLYHWTIDTDKCYAFMPERILVYPSGEKLVDGYIATDNGDKFHVYVDNQEYIDTVKKEMIFVRYREIYNFKIRVDIV